MEGEATAVEDLGISVAEVAFAHRWADPDAGAERRELFGLARRLGARRVNAGLWRGPEFAEMARAFAELCRAADAEGLEVALEFFPFGAIPTAAAALDVIEAADMANARLLFDAWHFHRAGAAWADLSRIWAGLVACAQISDATSEPAEDVGEESRHERLLPGEGVIDLGRILAKLGEETGPAVAVEVLSDRLDAEGPYRAAELALAASRKLLIKAGWTQDPGVGEWR
jgi:sugar phosphate isomerase/epimerase